MKALTTVTGCPPRERSSYTITCLAVFDKLGRSWLISTTAVPAHDNGSHDINYHFIIP